jgi:DNA-binding response OmpR family regulator
LIIELKRGGYIMSEFSLMILEEGFDRGIRCRFISEWFKIDFYVSSTERLLLEIERNNPDIVVMDLDLYGRIDGIETSRQIRSRFDVPVMYA